MVVPVDDGGMVRAGKHVTGVSSRQELPQHNRLCTQHNLLTITQLT